MLSTHVGGTFVIAPRGRLVYGELADLGRAFEQALSRRWGSIVLDLSNVYQIDCAALGRIVHSYVSALENRMSFHLLNPTRRVRQLLLVTELAGILPVGYEAEERCLVGCGSG